MKMFVCIYTDGKQLTNLHFILICLFTYAFSPDTQMLCQCTHAGSDYIVNVQNISSRTFTVTFQSKQANSTKHQILIADDIIVEGTEEFLLRIDTVRFIGQASVLFRPSDGVSNVVADVFIADDDCEFKNFCSMYHFLANLMRTIYAYVHVMHYLPLQL